MRTYTISILFLLLVAVPNCHIGFDKHIPEKSEKEEIIIEMNERYDCLQGIISYSEPVILEATAFCDESTCTLKKPKSNHTLAGKKEWLGMMAILYHINDNGKLGEYIGTYVFEDVGYGQPTGIGESELLEGQSLGTIETGDCIDIWMPTKAECEEWGRQKVYMQIINAKG